MTFISDILYFPRLCDSKFVYRPLSVCFMYTPFSRYPLGRKLRLTSKKQKHSLDSFSYVIVGIEFLLSLLIRYGIRVGLLKPRIYHQRILNRRKDWKLCQFVALAFALVQTCRNLWTWVLRESPSIFLLIERTVFRQNWKEFPTCKFIEVSTHRRLPVQGPWLKGDRPWQVPPHLPSPSSPTSITPNEPWGAKWPQYIDINLIC